MSKKGKVIGALIGVVLAGAGGIAGGVALANTQMDKQIAEAKDEAYQEGFDKGQATNPGGYTEEDLQNAKEEGKSELAEEYETVFAILTTQDRSQIFVNDNLELFSSNTSDVQGLIAHSIQDNKFYTLLTTGYGYLESGRAADDSVLVSSFASDVPGLFSVSQNLKIEEIANQGFNYIQTISNGKEMIATCYGFGNHPNVSSVVRIDSDGIVEPLITSEFGGDVIAQGEGHVVYERGSQNAYYSTQFGEYTKIDEIDVSITDGNYLTDSISGQGIIYFTNEDGKIAVYDLKNNKYFSDALTDEMFGGVLGYSYSSDKIVCAVYNLSTNLNRIVAYDLSTGEGQTVVEDIMNAEWSDMGNEHLFLIVGNIDQTRNVLDYSYSDGDITTYFENVNEAYVMSIGENDINNVHIGYSDDEGQHECIINVATDEVQKLF